MELGRTSSPRMGLITPPSPMDSRSPLGYSPNFSSPALGSRMQSSDLSTGTYLDFFEFKLLYLIAILKILTNSYRTI